MLVFDANSDSILLESLSVVAQPDKIAVKTAMINGWLKRDTFITKNPKEIAFARQLPRICSFLTTTRVRRKSNAAAGVTARTAAS